MTALIIGASALGAALGRLFEFLILAPLTAAIALIIFLEPPFWPHSALPKAIQFLALTVSLQFGYTLIMWLQCMRALSRRHINIRPMPITEPPEALPKASGVTTIPTGALRAQSSRS